MYPVLPVVIDSPEMAATMVAKDQPEFQTLPAIYLDDNNVCVSRWCLESGEREIVKEYKAIYLYLTSAVKLTKGFYLSALFEDTKEFIAAKELDKISFMNEDDKLTLIESFQMPQQYVARYKWELTEDDIEEILKNNSCYVYQFNQQQLISPFLMSVYSDQVIAI